VKYTEGGRVTEEWLAELEEAAGRWPRPWTMGVGSYVMKALIEELRELRAERADVLAEFAEYLTVKADNAAGTVDGSYTEGMRNAALDAELFVSSIRGQWRDEG
jgi:hypothetical protein